MTTTDLIQAALGEAATVGGPHPPTTRGAADGAAAPRPEPDPITAAYRAVADHLAPLLGEDVRDMAAGLASVEAALVATRAELAAERHLRRTAQADAVAADAAACRWRSMALRDRLTGLHNRTWVQLRQRIPACAVALVDLNGFKPVNDTYGHAAGNVVLRAMSRRMAAVNGATAVRYGGDEFVLLFDHGHQDVVGALFELDAALRDPVPLLVAGRQMQLHLSAAIGWTVVGADAVRLDGLLERADQAMYASKRTGEGPVRWSRHLRAVAA